MSYFDVYKKRMGFGNGDILDLREDIANNSINRNFDRIHGYRKANIVDIINQQQTPIDIIVSSRASELEKNIAFRPETKISIGSYVSYGDRTYIIREVDYDMLTPSSVAFYCNQVINIRGVEVDIPCYTNSTTYGSKGILDQTKFYELDSKTKIYIQKNDYTDNFKIGQRIMFDNKYIYKLTEVDDLVFKGMYTIVAQRDEAMPMDDFDNNIAWNEYEENIENDVLPSQIIGQDKLKLGTSATYTMNVENPNWSIDDETIATIIENNGSQVSIVTLKRGWFTITCNNSSLDVMVG